MIFKVPSNLNDSMIYDLTVKLRFFISNQEEAPQTCRHCWY